MVAAGGLTAEALWRIPRVGKPVPWRDDQIVVPVTTFDIDENRGTTLLYRLDASGESHRLTQTDARKPVLHGDNLAFLRKGGHQQDQVHLMNVTGGEAEQLTDLPLGVLGAKWLPDGSGLIVLAHLLAGHLSPEATATELERRDDEKSKVHVTEDATYRFWDTWLTTGEIPHLFHLDLETRRLRDLTPESTRWWIWPSVDDPVESFDISPDGSELAYVADRSQSPHRLLRWALFTIGISGGDERFLSEYVSGNCHRPRYSPDGATLVYGMTEIAEFYADRVRLVAINRSREEHRLLTADWDRSAGSWEFDGEGNLLVLAEDRGYQHLFRLDLAGGIPERLAGGGTLTDISVGQDGRVLMLRNSLVDPPEVVVLQTEGALNQVSRFTHEALANIEMGRVDELTIAGADNDPVQVFVVYPPGFETSAKYPMVHLIHGGPHGTFGDTWHWRWNAQCFTAPGYVVVLVNFHGSTSFGQDFTTAIHGGWGDLPYRDIEAATDYMIGQGFIDEERTALAGGSYGGYLAAFITSQTDRYVAAVAHAAVTDLPAMYASDFTAGRPLQFGAEIWDDRTAVERWSPSIHASGYSTPTLVIVGEKDYRVPAAQGLELYGVLVGKGVPTRLLYYPEENHWILHAQSSIHWYEEVLRWLNLYLS